MKLNVKYKHHQKLDEMMSTMKKTFMALAVLYILYFLCMPELGIYMIKHINANLQSEYGHGISMADLFKISIEITIVSLVFLPVMLSGLALFIVLPACLTAYCLDETAWLAIAYKSYSGKIGKWLDAASHFIHIPGPVLIVLLIMAFHMRYWTIMIGLTVLITSIYILTGKKDKNQTNYKGVYKKDPGNWDDWNNGSGKKWYVFNRDLHGSVSYEDLNNEDLNDHNETNNHEAKDHS